MEINTIYQILEAIGLLVGAATIIARITPTNKDNTVVEKIRKIFEKISNLFLPNR